jgi:rhodanese-related sulfurtransferase
MASLQETPQHAPATVAELLAAARARIDRLTPQAAHAATSDGAPHRDPALASPDVRQILLCDEGYQSCLLAATAQSFGLHQATDVVGGFQAWRAAGLPVEPRARQVHG